MKKIVVFIFFGYLPVMIYSKDVLPISAHYNPFQKAKKLIMKKKNIPVIKTKRKINKKVERPPMLAGIFNKKAFINGKLYKIGEKINGYLITAIEDDRVFLKKWGREVTLSLVKRRHTVYKKEDK